VKHHADYPPEASPKVFKHDQPIFIYKLRIRKIYKKSLKKKTVVDKIRHKLSLLKNTKINEMTEILIKEAKTIFAFALTINDKDPVFKLLIELFDERISTLPKDVIREIFCEFQDLKNAKSNEEKRICYPTL
jgi:hypothetical protein